LTLPRPGAPDRERLSWRWRAETPVLLGDFGLPASATGLRLCLFDQTGLRLSSLAPAGGLCRGRPCWSSTTSITYRDPDLTPDGLSRLSLRAGDPPRAAIAVQGARENLALPLLDLSLPVTARLKRDDGSPICWEATFSSATRRSPVAFDARSE
jgi:hypothetical protein